jgi:hypothetical protein
MKCHILVLALCCAPQLASAAVVALGFNSLPSAQGWTYRAEGPSHSGQLESNIWSTDGTTLAMSTMGSPLVGGSQNTYSQTGIVNTVNPFEVTWRLRVLESQGTVAGGWGVGVAVGAQQFTVGFITNAIWIDDSQIPFDATAFHDYRLAGAPGTNTYSLYIDNVLFANGSSITPFFPGNYILFGDLSGAANARAQLQAFTFRQVPEPAALVFGVYGTALCAIVARARRQA